MKKILFLIPLLALCACEDFDPWGKASKGLCAQYGYENCERQEPKPCELYGNCDAPKADTPKTDAPKADEPKADTPKADAPKSEPAKSCELYGNCGD